MSPDQLVAALREEDVPHERIADAIGLTRPVAWKLVNEKRKLKVSEIAPLTKLLDQCRRERNALAHAKGDGVRPNAFAQARIEAAEEADIEQRELDLRSRYVGVPMLPMYGGMGGGGIGEVLRDQELEQRLVPRILIEELLHGRPTDFIWIRVRGDSMEPDFQHDDELICDLRDTSPMQPGPFALFHEEGYYVKNVERTEEGKVRIFSSNPKYTSVEIANEQTQIIGRPVWFGRRL